ncbi:MAG: hypothetical protein V3R29_09400, partial [Candidatus Acidoferrales bacterium]
PTPLSAHAAIFLGRQQISSRASGHQAAQTSSVKRKVHRGVERRQEMMGKSLRSLVFVAAFLLADALICWVVVGRVF